MRLRKVRLPPLHRDLQRCPVTYRPVTVSYSPLPQNLPTPYDQRDQITTSPPRYPLPHPLSIPSTFRLPSKRHDYHAKVITRAERACGNLRDRKCRTSIHLVGSGEFGSSCILARALDILPLSHKHTSNPFRPSYDAQPFPLPSPLSPLPIPFHTPSSLLSY